jgi:hypothetical protein
MVAEYGQLRAEIRLKLAPVEVLADEVASLHQRVEELMRGD